MFRTGARQGSWVISALHVHNAWSFVQELALDFRRQRHGGGGRTHQAEGTIRAKARKWGFGGFRPWREEGTGCMQNTQKVLTKHLQNKTNFHLAPTLHYGPDAGTGYGSVWLTHGFHRWFWVVRNLEGSRGQVVEGFKRHGETCIVLDVIDHEEIPRALSRGVTVLSCTFRK